MKKEYVAYLLRQAAITFICSYKEAWEVYMTEEQKGGFDFKEIMEDM